MISLVVLLNGLLGYVQEARAEKAVAALARMTAVSSAVLRDGKEQRVPSAQLVRGDVLVLAEGDAVGADARLLQATSLRVQEASLTGESEAVLKDAATLPEAAPLGDRLNMVIKGTAVAQGTGRAVVTATGMRTEMGAIAAMLEATVEAPTPLQREVARIGRVLGIAVLVVATVVVGTVLLLSDIRTASDDNFATIVEAVREGRSIFDNIRKSLRYLLSSNMGEVLTVFLGVVGAGVIGLRGAGSAGDGGALVLPLLATQILWLGLTSKPLPD